MPSGSVSLSSKATLSGYAPTRGVGVIDPGMTCLAVSIAAVSRLGSRCQFGFGSRPGAIRADAAVMATSAWTAARLQAADAVWPKGSTSAFTASHLQVLPTGALRELRA